MEPGKFVSSRVAAQVGVRAAPRPAGLGCWWQGLEKRKQRERERELDCAAVHRAVRVVPRDKDELMAALWLLIGFETVSCG